MKILKILITLILITLLGGFLYFFMQKNTKRVNIDEAKQPLSENTPQKNQEKNTENITRVKESLKEDFYREDILTTELEKNILNWSQTNKFEFLQEALSITYSNPNNESSFDPWKNIIKTNSSKVLLSLDQNSLQENLKAAYSVYDWFINLSGEYEKLTQQERQEISKDFMQVEIYINSR